MDTRTDSNRALYRAFSKGDQTEAQLRKASKLDDDEFDATLANWRNRMWLVTVDEDAKTPKLRITDLAKGDMSVRYPD